MERIVRIGMGVALLGGIFGCGVKDNSLSGGGGPGPGGGGSDMLVAPASLTCDGVGLKDEGCGCNVEGSHQPCWPGDPAARGRGDCHDGIQICIGHGEFRNWGTCQGYTLGMSCNGPCTPSEIQSCKMGPTGQMLPGVSGDGGSSSGDGGKEHISGDDGGGVTGDGGMCAGECVPGTQRWCDEPVYCRWGKQDCAIDGRWGVCIEVMQKPGGCLSLIYDQQCCAVAGACCQELSNPLVDKSGHLYYPSIGKCDGIASPCK